LDFVDVSQSAVSFKIEGGMSILVILGNTNEATFANSIIVANRKATELFGTPLTHIFVIHSRESLSKLNEDLGWVNHLEGNNVSQEIISHRIIEISSTTESVERFVNYLEIILRGVSENSNLLVDLTNSTTVYKNLLSTAAYILDLKHQYMIDISKLSQLTKDRGFLPLDFLQASYVSAPDITQLDNIAYLNLAEMIRYKRLIEDYASKLVEIDRDAADKRFFEDNLAHSIELKLRGDRTKDNALYRIAASSLAASTEDLITLIVNKLSQAYPSARKARTFGDNLKVILLAVERENPENFDLEFFRKFNDFILYLRNSTVHKGRALTSLEKFKADLVVKMSFPFIEFYIDIIHPIISSQKEQFETHTKRIRKLSNLEVDPNDIFYFSLDGDDTGARLEELFLTDYGETEVRKLSHSITRAIKEIRKYIEGLFAQKSIIFATGDDILFKGHFDEKAVQTMQQMYQEITSLTCSIGYGRSFYEVYLALKIAKAEPGKNSLVGIEIQ
jgi:hypothetical protein